MRSLSLALFKGAQQSLAPAPRTLKHRRVWGWFCLMLAYSTVVALLMWNEIAGDPYALADDARQHVVWMLRFSDPEIFANDWIADYYQSVSSVGYAGLYWIFAKLGVSPLVLCKWLPPVLVLLTGAIAFLTVLELCALPAAGFAAAVLLTQSVEYTGTVASGTSKAFVYGLTFLFMYAWLRRSRWLTWAAIVLQGIFYPQAVLLSAGMLTLGLIRRRQGRWHLSPDRNLWGLTLGGVAVAVAVIVYYGLSTSQFGPTMTAEQALTMPEFFDRGRTEFFNSTLKEFLLYGRSGLRLDTAMTPVTNLLALGLPLLMKFPRRWPLVETIGPDIDILPKLVVTALAWFFAAHILLFKLYLPSRYTGRFLLMVCVLGAGIALVVLVDGLLRWAIALLSSPAGSHDRLLSLLPGGLSALLALLLVFYPLTMPGYPSTSTGKGHFPELYEFLASQPKASLVASLSYETTNIPSFAQRSVLLSPEVAIPYHAGYYQEIRRRAKDLITAQYTPDPQVVADFIEQYGVTHWLLEATTFDIHTFHRDRWVQQYQPEAGQATSILARGGVPVLQAVGDRCVIFDSPPHRVIDASCLLNELRQPPDGATPN